MIRIITGKTTALYMRPCAPPYCLNRASEQAQGLVRFWPLGDNTFASCIDLVRGDKLTQNGTMTRSLGPDGVGIAVGNTGSTSNWLSLGSVPVSTQPLSINTWFYPVNVTSSANVVVIGESVTGSNYNVLVIDGAAGYAAGDPVVALVEAGGEAFAASTTGYTAGTWHMGTATFATALRTAYLDGKSPGTETTSKTPTGQDDTQIGAFRVGASTFGPMNGRICNVGLWNRALNAAQVYQLWEPSKRWDLLYPLGRRIYFDFISTAGGRVALNTRAFPLGVEVGMGWRMAG